MSQQKGKKLWKTIGKKQSQNSNKSYSQSSSIQLTSCQNDNLKLKNNIQKQQNNSQSEDISFESRQHVNQSMNFLDQIKTLGVQIKQVQVISQAQSPLEFNQLQSNSVFSKMANKFQTKFLGKQQEDLNNSQSDNYSPMIAIGSPFISSHSQKIQSEKALQFKGSFIEVLKLLFQLNEERLSIKKQVQSSMQFFKKMTNLYEDAAISKLQKNKVFQHSIIAQNSCQDYSQIQARESHHRDEEQSQKLIKQLQSQLQVKIHLIQDLQHLIEANKKQYLTFKEMYQKTNNQLNDQMDQIDKKLTQATNKCVEYQNAKLQMQTQLQSLKDQIKNAQTHQTEQLRNSASFKILQISPTKTIGRIFTFQKDSAQKNGQQISELQKYIKIQSNVSDKNKQEIIRACNLYKQLYRQDLLELKQKKLKQYQKTIEQLSNQIHFLSSKSDTFQNQLKAKKSEFQAITLQFQKENMVLKQINQKFNHLKQENYKYQHYTQVLEQKVFDFQQKVEQTQQQCNYKLIILKQQVLQEQAKFKTIQQNYKNVVQKLSGYQTINEQNKSAILIDSPTKMNKTYQHIRIQSKDKIISQIEHQLQTYKNMNQDKDRQIRRLENEIKKLSQKNINLVQDQMERETDKFRLQSFRQESKLKQNILKSYKSQKQELLSLLNNQRQQLVQKSNKIDMLQLKISKLQLELKQQKQSKVNKKSNNHQFIHSVKLANQGHTYPCDCNKKQKFYLQKQQQLHHLEMQLQSQKRMLQVTKRQIQSDYQSLLIKFNQLKQSQLQSINTKSIQHLSAPLQNFFSNDNNKTWFRNSLAASPRTYQNQAKNISNQASRIIQRLKSQGNIRDRSTDTNRSKNKVVNNLRDYQKHNHGNLFSQTVKRSSIGGQLNLLIRQSQPYSPLKDKIKQRGQSRKLKMKMIQQKMRKLKDQVKNSLN